MTPSSVTIVPTLLFALCACRPEPELNCERVRFGWPPLQLDPSADVSSAEGLQVNLSVRSDLLPSALAKLSIAESGPEGDQDKVLIAQTLADSDGLLIFAEVNVPLGSLVFFIDAEDECGQAHTGRRAFVWDGLGQPQCQLGLASGPVADPVTGIFDLRAEHDEDSDTPGMQVSVVIDAERPDMQVSLFVVDRETGTSQDFELAVDASGVGQQSLTLAEGEQAVRAVCYWQSQELRLNTPTRIYFVDSQ